MSVRSARILGPSALLLLVLALGVDAEAKATSFAIDGSHSTVLFRCKHIGTSWSYGRFNEVGGSFALDEANPSASAIDLEIASKSLDTNDAKRDDHLRGPDFFNCEQFPTIEYVSTKVAKAADGAYDVTGNLTFHGVTKPVSVRLVKTGEATNEKFGHRVGFEGAFTIKRSEFGMDKMLDLLGDEVFVTISIEGVEGK